MVINDVCIVSSEELDSIGGPVVIIHSGQEIKFCCATYQPTFEKNPHKNLSKLAMESLPPTGMSRTFPEPRIVPFVEIVACPMREIFLYLDVYLKRR